MPTLEEILLNIDAGKSKKVRGLIVKSDGVGYEIDGYVHDLQDAIKQIEQKGKTKGFPYELVAFILVRPPSKVISTHKIHNKTEHSKLIEDAVSRGLYVYYADVQKADGKYYAKHPWIVDWDSVPEEGGIPNRPSKKTKKKTKSEETEPRKASPVSDDTLKCPFCGKIVSSTPGRTLHVKCKHPDRLEEYIAQK